MEGRDKKRRRRRGGREEGWREGRDIREETQGRRGGGW